MNTKTLTIQETIAFKKMDAIQQKIAVMSNNRKIIKDSAILLKNIGSEKWELYSKQLPNHWKNIVKELAAV